MSETCDICCWSGEGKPPYKHTAHIRKSEWESRATMYTDEQLSEIVLSISENQPTFDTVDILKEASERLIRKPVPS